MPLVQAPLRERLSSVRGASLGSAPWACGAVGAAKALIGAAGRVPDQQRRLYLEAAQANQASCLFLAEDSGGMTWPEVAELTQGALPVQNTAVVIPSVSAEVNGATVIMCYALCICSVQHPLKLCAGMCCMLHKHATPCTACLPHTACTSSATMSELWRRDCIDPRGHGARRTVCTVQLRSP